MKHVKNFDQFLNESTDNKVNVEFLIALKKGAQRTISGEKAINDFIDSVDMSDFGGSGDETEKEYNAFIRDEKALYTKALSLAKTTHLDGFFVDDEALRSIIMKISPSDSIVKSTKTYTKPLDAFIKKIVISDVTFYLIDDGAQNYFILYTSETKKLLQA